MRGGHDGYVVIYTESVKAVLNIFIFIHAWYLLDLRKGCSLCLANFKPFTTIQFKQWCSRNSSKINHLSLQTIENKNKTPQYDVENSDPVSSPEFFLNNILKIRTDNNPACLHE